MHVGCLHAFNTIPDPFGACLSVIKLRALTIHRQRRIRSTVHVTRRLARTPRILGIGCSNLNGANRCSLITGCFPGKVNAVLSFLISNSRGGIEHVLSKARMFSCIPGVNSTHSLVISPTHVARHRIPLSTHVTTKIDSGLVELSVKLRGISSLVTSLSRTVTGTC